MEGVVAFEGLPASAIEDHIIEAAWLKKPAPLKRKSLERKLRRFMDRFACIVVHPFLARSKGFATNARF
jgi:hypothetical protein